MEIIARAKYVQMSPRKLRLVANLIKGLKATDAKWQLTFNKKIASRPLLKVLDAAVANATSNFNLSKDNLKIKTLTVDGGPAIKRWQPRAHGRATPIRRETSHVKLILTEIIESGAVKSIKAADKSDIIKVGTGEFDELKSLDTEKTKEDKSLVAKSGAKSAGKKGFASRVLTRKTGSK